MSDEERLRDVAKELSDRLFQCGLKPIKFKLSGNIRQGWSTPVASWDKDRPKIGIWFDHILNDTNRYFWFGFFSPQQKKVTDLISESSPIVPSFATVTDDDLEDGRFSELKVKETKQKDGLAYEMFDDDYYWFGKYMPSVTRSDAELVNDATSFIMEIIRFVAPEFELRADIAKVEKQPGLLQTDREQLIKARKGQGKFRSDLFELWKGCAVTGCAVSEVLRASHIRPWKESDNLQRLDPNNGLLLTATLDALFDRKLITFEDNGSMIISDRLPKNQISNILNEQRQLRNTLSDGQKSYLAYHRSLVLGGK